MSYRNLICVTFLDIVKKYSINIEKDEFNKLNLYKDARNDLAHLKPQITKI